jgi:DNA-binding MarR family transcriptional regulator
MSTQINFEDTVSYLLARVATAFRKSLERSMGRIGLHGGQIFVILELGKKDGLRQVDIASSLDISPPTVNKMIKGMLEMGVIDRLRIDDDARSTRIFLTPRGRAMWKEIEGEWIELEEECLSALTETERLVLFDLLKKLRNSYTGRTDDEDE